MYSLAVLVFGCDHLQQRRHARCRTRHHLEFVLGQTLSNSVALVVITFRADHFPREILRVQNDERVFVQIPVALRMESMSALAAVQQTVVLLLDEDLFDELLAQVTLFDVLVLVQTQEFHIAQTIEAHEKLLGRERLAQREKIAFVRHQRLSAIALDARRTLPALIEKVTVGQT